MNEPSPVSGPACTDGGPSVDLAITLYLRGKPPLETFVTNLRVRNPLGVPVWLLYNVGDSFPSIVSSVVLSRMTSGPPARLWVFSGDGSFEAARIPSGGQLTMRDVGLSCRDRARPLALVFAKRISIDGQPAEQWLGLPGLMPSSGEISLSLAPPDTKTEREWHGESLNAPDLHVDVLCITHLNLPQEVITP